MSIGALYPTTKPSLLLDFAKTKELDPRITFTRASTATFYDNDTSAKAEENLLVRSQEFDSVSWIKNASSVTTNSTTAPDGTTTAETIIENSASGVHVAYQESFIALTTVYTLSVFIKADTRNFGMVRVGGGNFTNAPTIKVDLTNGTVTTIDGTVISSSATSVGNGWYRCVMTFTSGSNTLHTPQFGPHDNSSSSTYTGNGTGSVFAWGAQLEQRSSVTAYTATTTAAITNYIPVLLTAASGIPRFDHNPISRESLGLLIEEQRTNLVTYSSEFDNAAWTKTRATITPNAAIAPDGTQTADALIEDSSNNSHFVNNGATVVNGSVYTASIYAKANQRGYLSLIVISSTAASNTFFNLINGTIVSTSANATSSITPVGNGWYRCAISVTVSSTGVSMYPGISADGITSSYQGNGFSGIFIWGAQFELGAFATSYTPTVASQITRSADNASMTGTNFSQWFNQNEGTIYSDYFPAVVGTVYALDDSSYSNRCPQASVGTAFFVTNGTVVASLGITLTANQNIKTSIAYATNDYALVNNGATPSVDTSGALPSNISRLVLGADSGLSTRMNGTIKKIAYYPKRLTNTELQGLTS